MGFIYTGGFLMGKTGFAFSKNCCCVGIHCYCYVHSRFYGSQIVERRVVCFRDPVWDSDAGRWVYPDGQPCVGTAPPGSSGCNITYEGNLVKLCACGSSSPSNPGESWNWSLLNAEGEEAEALCPTVLPPP